MPEEIRFESKYGAISLKKKIVVFFQKLIPPKKKKFPKISLKGGISLKISLINRGALLVNLLTKNEN